MPNAFLRKLEALGSVPIELRREIESLTSHVDRLDPREDIAREGEEVDVVNVLLTGWAGLYKSLPLRKRQITAVFLPGDICDPNTLLPEALNHRVATLTPATVARLPADAFRALVASDIGLTRALQWEISVAIGMQREWTFSLGRRSAIERVAHLLCEICTRLEPVGLIDGSECEFPLSQTDIADATGLSNVHINRVMRDLRVAGLAELHRKRLIIPDRQRLAKVAFFDPTYLHGDTERGLVRRL